MMKGWIYKELRQRWPYLLTVLFLSIMPFLNLKLFGWTFNGIDERKFFHYAETFAILAGSGFIQMMMLKGDERKSFGYFTTTTSGGYQSFLLIKYGIILFMAIIFFTGYNIAELIYNYGDGWSYFRVINHVRNILIPVLCIQLIVRAIDIPFTYRFGTQRGNTVKVISLIILSFVLAIMLALTDDFERIMETARSAFRIIESLKVWPVFIACSMFIYYLSYRITCLLYLKGVEHYGE